MSSIEKKNFFSSKKGFSKKKFKIISIVNTVIDLCVLIFLGLFLYAFYLMPFPERLNPSDFDEIMIQKGELITLYTIFVSLSFLFTLYIGHIVISIIINYYLFFHLKPFNEKNKILWKTLFLIYSFFAILIPVIPLIFIWFFYFKKINFSETKKPHLKTKILLNSYFCLVPFSIAAIFVPIFTIQKNVVVNETATKQNLTYSNNHNNIVVFYFDRAYNHLWNQLLYVDYKLNKDNSFIKQFPEFTSFYNVNINGYPTSFSNLSLLGGIWYDTSLMGTNYVNPIANKNYNKYKQGMYLKEAISNLLNNTSKYGFDKFHIMDLPYYGNSFTSLSGEYNLLNNDLQNENKNAFASSSSEILKEFGQEYKTDSSDSARYYNFITQKNEDGKLKYINFEKTETDIFKMIYSQNTHGPYSFYENNVLNVTDDSLNNFIKSMWFSIQSLKTLLSSFKNENSENGLSVYDNTMFVVVSDHGTNLAKNDFNNYLEFLTNYVDYEKYASNQTMLDYFQNSGSFSPVFMVKPFLKNTENNLTNLKNENLNVLQNFFNTSYTVSLSDFPSILESEMFKLKNNYIKDSSFYKPNINQEMYSDEIIKYIANNAYVDPLNSLKNVKNRTIKIPLAEDWRWKNNSLIFKEWAYNIINYKNSNDIYEAEITLVK